MECQIQPFESEVAGVSVCKLQLGDFEDPGRAGALDALADGWRRDGVWLVVCRISDDSDTSLTQLREIGFRPVEALLTLQRDLTGNEQPAETELAGPGDTDACVAVSGEAFTFDRLHRDPQVPDTLADGIREAWVRNDLNGRGDACLVARTDGAVSGFNLCLLNGDTAVIDLIAVAPAHQGKGIGGQLVAGALHHYRDRAARMQVGTQADNAASIALYAKAGFSIIQSQTTLHWINPDVAPAAPAMGRAQ